LKRDVKEVKEVNEVKDLGWERWWFYRWIGGGAETVKPRALL